MKKTVSNIVDSLLSNSDVSKENPVALPETENDHKEVVNKVIEEQTSILKKLADSDYTNSAVGLFRDSKQHWSLIEIKYDPKNLTVSKDVIVHETGDNSRSTILERFKIFAQNNILCKENG